MARPIKETPTLYGEDARRFAYAVEHPQPISKEELERMEAAHSRMMSIVNFAF